MICDVTIRCDRTGETISTGIELDPTTFKSLPDIPALLPRCPACGGEHEWSPSEACLKGREEPLSN